MEFIKNHKNQLIMLGVSLVICGMLYSYHQYQEQRLHQAVQLTAEQVTDINNLQNELKISKQNAEQLVSEIKKAQNKTQPATYITVQAPSAERVIETVTERINSKDTSLPDAAMEQADRTVVAEQPENKEYQVGVYKINLNKPHKIKAGFSYINDKPYVNVGYQHNRLEFVAHLNSGQIKGGSVIWTAAEW